MKSELALIANPRLRVSKDSDRLKLSINGQNILDWFKQKYQELKQSVRPHIKPIPPKQKRGQGV